MKWRTGIALGLASALVGGCGGDDEVPFDPFAKASAPELPTTFQGKDVDVWLTQATSTDATRRAEAAWALGEVGSAKDHGRVLGLLLLDADASVQLATLHALHQLGTVPEVLIPRVLALGASDASAVASLAKTLAGSVDMEAVEGKALGLLLDDEDPAVRIRGLELLEARGEDARSFGRQIASLARSDDDVTVRKRALKAIGVVDPESAALYAAEVIPLLLEKDERSRAIEEVSALGASAKPALEAFLRTREAQESKEAAQIARMLLLRIK